jgi:hypothetical protein
VDQGTFFGLLEELITKQNCLANKEAKGRQEDILGTFQKIF